MKVPIETYERLNRIKRTKRWTFGVLISEALDAFERQDQPPPSRYAADPADGLLDEAVSLGISDLAEQHDHYASGAPKREPSD